jgi:hypothetical protein
MTGKQFNGTIILPAGTSIASAGKRSVNCHIDEAIDHILTSK